MSDGRYATEQMAGDSVVALIDGCRRGDDQFISEFYRRYQSGLTAFARRRGADDPEGVADLAIFETIRRLPDLRQRDEASVRAYLYRAVRNRVIDERRRSKLELVPLDDRAWADDLAPAGQASAMDPTFESEVADNEQFRSLLNDLTDAQREVIVHRFVGGYSSHETARRVGRSTSAVRRLQHEALTRLRLVLTAAALLALAAGLAAWLNSSQGRVSVLETEPANSSGPEVDGIDRNAGRALVADTVTSESDDPASSVESSLLVGQRPASTAAPYRGGDDQRSTTPVAPSPTTTPGATSPTNQGSTSQTSTAPTSPSTTKPAPTTTTPNTTVLTSSSLTNPPITSPRHWRNPPAGDPTSFQEHLEVELVAANNCLDQASTRFIGLPNGAHNPASHDFTYLAATNICVTQTNLEQILAENDEWQQGLTNDERDLLNSAMIEVLNCVRAEGWDVGPSALNDAGVVYFTRFPAEAWDDPQARGYFGSLEACGWFELSLG